ncbi:DNA-binding protein [candidate division LCP-89 bacterium B3_LCP]|uniref:DNA-binding protein n=1 Tax=candidate division LCP-89 bacterium B3_LCP TaxID=2012998 RepID=A0A532UZA9_UNCL8|nr:MAG: DNA-binding protein [candidate division LCP-89 bacterium B3_LCP]
MSDLLKEWLTKAEGDYVTAKREAEALKSPNYDAACFHAQQCIEKLMKAALIKFSSTPPKTHDLYQLYILLEPLCVDFRPDIKDLRYLTRAAVDFRYPGESADREEAEEAIAICSCLRKALLSILKK